MSAMRQKRLVVFFFNAFKMFKCVSQFCFTLSTTVHMSPYLVLIFLFHSALHRSDNASKTVPCDGNIIKGKSPEHYRLEYSIYLMFLDEGDTSEETFFSGVEKMAYPDVIKTNGRKVSFLQ